ncbi:hypothetical protein ACGFS9_15555 [Streptomyces sp. NPDC048566]
MGTGPARRAAGTSEIAGGVTACPSPEGVPEYPVVIRPIADGAGDI